MLVKAFWFRTFIFLLLFPFAIFQQGVSFAESSGFAYSAEGRVVLDAKRNSMIELWKGETKRLLFLFSRSGGLTPSELDELRKRAKDLTDEVIRLQSRLKPELKITEKFIERLTPDWESEDTDNESRKKLSIALSKDRAVQEEIAIRIDTQLRQLEFLRLRLDDLIRKTSGVRFDQFVKHLVYQQESVLAPILWWDAIASLPRFVSAVKLLLYDWRALLSSRDNLHSALISFTLLFLLAILFLFARQRWLAATDRDPSIAEPAELQKSLLALGIFLANSGFISLWLFAFRVVINLLELVPGRLNDVVDGLCYSLITSVSIWSLGIAILAPLRDQWRMIRLSDAASLRVVYLLLLLAILYCFGSFSVNFASALPAPEPFTVLLTGGFVLSNVLVITLILSNFTRENTIGIDSNAASDLSSVTSDQQSADDGLAESNSMVWSWVLPLAWTVTVSAVVSTIFGYVSFATFLIIEMIWVGLLIAFTYVILDVLDELVAAAFKSGSSFSFNLVRYIGVSYSTVEQIGVVLSGGARLIVVIPALLCMFVPSGISVSEAWWAAYDFFRSFNVWHGLGVSPYALLSGVLLFVSALAITRAGQRWLNNSFLPRTHLDVGVKDSVRITFGYVGFICAVIIGVLAAGLKLHNIAIVAGALSVGIGFGLQSVVSNFVSGLILLVERPIKTGDIVEIGTEKGMVRKINIRSTEIETFDRASLIIPNSSLISGNVKNWMHRDLTGRCLVDMLVAADADIEKAKTIFLSCAAEHQQVLFFPMPHFTVTGFVDNAVRLCLICVIGDAGEVFFVESDLRMAILSKLRENGISLAQPRYVLSLDENEGGQESQK